MFANAPNVRRVHGRPPARTIRLLAALVVLAPAACRMAIVPSPAPPTADPVPPAATDPAVPSAGAPAVPALAVGDATGTEGDGMLHIPVRLSPAAAVPVTVSYATEDVTATAGADYQPATGVLTFAAGAIGAARIEVPVLDDAVAEGDETFSVHLSEADGAAVAVAVATVTVVDNDGRRVSVQPLALNVPEGGSAAYLVALGSQPTGTVTVTPASGSAEVTMAPARLTFSATEWDTARSVTVTAAADEDAVADAPVQLTHTASGGGYGGTAVPAVRLTIVEADVATLAVAGARGAEHVDRLGFAVTLSAAADRVVTAEYETGGGAEDSAAEGEDYRGVRGTLRFPAGATAAHTIEVVLVDDGTDEADEQFALRLHGANAPLAGGADTVTVTGTIVDDDEPPLLSVAAASLQEGAVDGRIRFAVSLLPASGRQVTVAYATTAGGATESADYESASGTLTFAAGSTGHTVAVPVADDDVHEDQEQFTLTLSAAVNATLAATGRAATGTIVDNDEPPQLSIAGARLTEGDADGNMRFTVSLHPVSERPVAVAYATSDATATAGEDYTVVTGSLTFAPGTTARTVAVPIADDDTVEDTESFTVALSNPTGARLAGGTASGLIVSDDLFPLKLSAFSAGPGSRQIFPAFDPDIHHYAVRACTRTYPVTVTATAMRPTATLTLRRADPADNLVTTGSLSTKLRVDSDAHLVVEVSDADSAVTYSVHCVPVSFPNFEILTERPEASDGLLLVTPRWRVSRPANSYVAIVDNNGVPRFHLTRDATRNFRRHADGRYSFYFGGEVHLLDSSLQFIEAVKPVPPLKSANPHDFLITGNGNHLFTSYLGATRDRCEVTGCDPGTEEIGKVTDAWIQEVTPAGDKVFEWNSWDHLKLSDCEFVFPADYAHLNSLHLTETGDIIASFRHCNTVVRIDRSGGTGRVVWQVGGTAPPRDSDTLYLPISGDTAGHNEFCGQHSATLSDSGALLIFDNGNLCRGERNNEKAFSRVVEYQLMTSGSPPEARFRRQYLLPDGNGYASTRGSVVTLPNGHWLVAWGTLTSATHSPSDLLAISEIDPATGTPVQEIAMRSSDGRLSAYTYRAYRESGIEIPPNLP